MENQIPTESQPVRFYKRKAVVIPAVVMMSLLGVAIAASILYSTTNVVVNVPEPLSDSGSNLNIATAFPNETVQRNLSISNNGPNPLRTQILWTQDTNANGVSYTTNLPMNVSIPNGTTVVSVTWTIAADSPVGSFNGTITKLRTA